MIDGGEPSVVEFNARLGDPETQVVLPLLKATFSTPFWRASRAVSTRCLSKCTPDRRLPGGLASGGYPDAFETGRTITIDPAEESGRGDDFHAGTALRDGRLVTSGGRVLSVTALGSTLRECLQKAYRAVDRITFRGRILPRGYRSQGAVTLLSFHSTACRMKLPGVNSKRLYRNTVSGSSPTVLRSARRKKICRSPGQYR